MSTISNFETKIRNAKSREEILNMQRDGQDYLSEDECIKIKAMYMGLSEVSVKLMLKSRKQMTILNEIRGFQNCSGFY